MGETMGGGARQREGKIKREGCESLGFHFVFLHAPKSSRIMISVKGSERRGFVSWCQGRVTD